MESCLEQCADARGGSCPDFDEDEISSKGFDIPLSPIKAVESFRSSMEDSTNISMATIVTPIKPPRKRYSTVASILVENPGKSKLPVLIRRVHPLPSESAVQSTNLASPPFIGPSTPRMSTDCVDVSSMDISMV